MEDGAGEGGLPLLGHMLEFGKNPFHFMTKARAECGELAEFKLFGDRLVLMTGPEANEAFCRAPDSQLDQSAAYKVMTPIFGEGVVFDAPEKKKNEQLKMLMPALRDKPMRSYANVIGEEVAVVIDWPSSESLLERQGAGSVLTTVRRLVPVSDDYLAASLRMSFALR